MNNLKVVGIDPGKGGGICCIREKSVEVSPMIDVDQMVEYLQYLKLDGFTIVFLEKVQAWVKDEEATGKGIGIAKLLANYNQIETTLKILKIPYVLVHPATWQKDIKSYGVDPKKFKNKKNAWKAFAIQKYPRLLSRINLKTSDAICIAWYGMNQLRTSPTNTLKKVQNKSVVQSLKFT